VITRYHARTAVERWQIQDRLRLRLRHVAPRRAARFYETPAGELAFSLWTGWRPPARFLAALREIDREQGEGVGERRQPS